MKRIAEPLRKVTLNLYDSDVEDMQRIYQWGWSEKVRQIIHQHLLDRERQRTYERN